MSVLFLNHAADLWSEAIWRASWQGGLAIMLVWTLTKAWQSMPPLLRCWLWRFVFIKFAVAFFCSTPIELAWLPANASPIAGQLDADSLATTSITHSSDTVSPDSRVADLEPLVQWPTIGAWLVVLWVGGIGISIVRLQGSCWAARRLRLGAAPVGDSQLLDAVARLSRRMGIARPPALRTASSVPGPLVIGVFRPAVILPTTLLERGDRADLELVLAHELAHCRRRDLAWAWLPTLVRALFFFHPLVWLACREARLASEIACDQLAIEDTDKPASAYADVLLRVAIEVSRCGSRRPLGAIGVFESYQSLKRRLKALANFGTMSPRQLRLTLIPAFAIAIALIVPWRLTSQTIAGPTDNGPPSGDVDEGSSENGKPQTIAIAQFPYALQFEQGATQFLDGDKITIQSVRGTADKIAPGNIYWIRGTYQLASRSRASLSAYVTAQNVGQGTNVPTLAVQTTTVNKGEGSFTLYLPTTYRGWPHVSFYPAEGGEVFGGIYFGTGDSALKDSRIFTAQQAEKALQEANRSESIQGATLVFSEQKTERRRRRWHLNFNTRGAVDHLNQLAALGAILVVPDQHGGFRVFSELRVRQPRGIHMDDLQPINRLGFADQDRKTVSGISRELDMPSAPYLLAFFPKELEEKMHQMEEAYQGVKEDQIREKTYFKVVPRGTSYDVVVDEQAMGPPPGKPNQKLKETLDQNVSIDFAPGPLTEALNYFAQRYDISITIAEQVFDHRGMKNIGMTKVSAPNASGRLADILQNLLDQANATYRVSREGDSLIIVPK
jgi:beta-lactamase regulating signal transducer with metallopeptidase domain